MIHHSHILLNTYLEDKQMKKTKNRKEKETNNKKEDKIGIREIDFGEET